MAFSSSTKKVATTKLIKVVETKVNGHYSTEDSGAVDKVLDGYGLCIIEASEKFGDNFQVSGKVNFVSVYSDENKLLCSQNLVLDFNEKIAVGDADALFAKPILKNIKQTRETPSIVEVTATVELAIYGTTSETIVALNGGNDGYYEVSKQIDVEEVVSSGNSSFTVSEEYEINEDVTKLVSAEASMTISKVTPNENYVVVDGTITRDLVFMVGDIVKKSQRKTDFSQEVSLLNVTSTAVLDARFNLATNNVALTPNEEHTKTLVTTDAVVQLALWGKEKTSMTVVEDIFGLNSDLKLDYSTFNNTKTENLFNLSDRVNALVDVQDKKRLDEIVTLGRTETVVEECNVVGGVATIAGVIKQMVIGKNYDNEEMYSFMLDCPFAIQGPTPDAISDGTIYADVTARPISFKNKAGRDISLVYDIDALLHIETTEVESFLTNVTETELETKREHNIIIYNTEPTETLFEVAKKLKVAPDVILAQNPSLTDTAPLGKIVVYTKCN